MKVLVQDQLVYIYTATKTIETSKPSVLMVHGAQHDHSVWVLQSRYLAHHGFNVLAVDLPGHGKSLGQALPSIEALAQWLLDLVTSLELEHIHWVGQHGLSSSIGGCFTGADKNAFCGFDRNGVSNARVRGSIECCKRR
jgi:alpha-beta hydrolase superfamily lysophospholipase